MQTRKHNLVPLLPAAKQLGISPSWLRREAEAGRIPHLRAGDRLLFVPEIVQRVLAERASRIEHGGDNAAKDGGGDKISLPTHTRENRGEA